MIETLKILPQQAQVKISVIVPLYNAQKTIAACLGGITASIYPNYELIVVDDGSTDGSQQIAETFSPIFIQLTAGPLGPAFARNRGAEAATGEILFFVDSDVVIYPDTLAVIVDAFETRPEFDALFGSYDDEPGDPSFLSQYKNLTHAFVHRKAREDGSTFWSGCGAIKRSAFMQLGGFDATKYPRPSIEDIELGCRIKARGGRIWVNKQIEAKHLKKWTLRGLVRTDIVDRAIPWTLLILRNRDLPNDLNLGASQRFSAVFTAALFLITLLLFFQGGLLITGLLVAALLLSANNWEWKGKDVNISLTLSKLFFSSICLAVCIWIALFNGMRYLIPGLSLWFLITLGLPIIRGFLPAAQRLAMIVIFTAIALSYVGLLISLPFLYSIPAVLLLSGVVLLNYDLYQYLFRKRGVLLAGAALPMQLFYYLYSLAAFFAGITIHLWVDVLKPKLSFLNNEQST